MSQKDEQVFCYVYSKLNLSRSSHHAVLFMVASHQYSLVQSIVTLLCHPLY